MNHLITPRLYALVQVSTRERGDSFRLSPDGTMALVALKGDGAVNRARLAQAAFDGKVLTWEQARTLKAEWDGALSVREGRDDAE